MRTADGRSGNAESRCTVRISSSHGLSYLILSASSVGPVLEAFGFQRIIFGSSPLPSSNIDSRIADWYALARESFAELGVEQDAIDAVFFDNAKRAYGVV